MYLLCQILIVPFLSSPRTPSYVCLDHRNTYTYQISYLNLSHFYVYLHVCMYLPTHSIFLCLLTITGLLELILVYSNILPSMVGLTSAKTAKMMVDGGGVAAGGGMYGTVHRCMRHFMGLFFVTFSMFKLVNLTTFVDVFEKYDLVTKRW